MTPDTLPLAFVLLDLFGISVFAVPSELYVTAAALAAGLLVLLVLAGVLGAVAALIAAAAGFALRGAAITRGWSLPPYRG